LINEDEPPPLAVLPRQNAAVAEGDDLLVPKGLTEMREWAGVPNADVLQEDRDTTRSVTARDNLMVKGITSKAASDVSHCFNFQFVLFG
jgi:hypothetical protein